MAKLLVLTDKNFSHEVLESEIPVLVDFWASWCPPCKMVEPMLRELARELYGNIKIAKINVDQNPYCASDYVIAGVPTFILFYRGTEVMRCVGAQSKKQLLKLIEEKKLCVNTGVEHVSHAKE